LTTSDDTVAELLAAWRAGDAEASRRLVSLVYDELRRLAHWHRGRARDDETLTTTALVHETLLKLTSGSSADYRERAHFMAVAAVAMRQLLVDHARERQAQKRGGGMPRVDLEADALAAEGDTQALLDLDEALTALAGVDARLANVVELRFFGGLTEDETADALGVTARTVRRDWTKAKALLRARLGA
jgi:RNA polymerase sigma factor (TIGR02999 family)